MGDARLVTVCGDINCHVSNKPIQTVKFLMMTEKCGFSVKYSKCQRVIKTKNGCVDYDNFRRCLGIQSLGYVETEYCNDFVENVVTYSDEIIESFISTKDRGIPRVYFIVNNINDLPLFLRNNLNLFSKRRTCDSPVKFKFSSKRYYVANVQCLLNVF